MEFAFRAGDRRPRRPSPDRRFAPRAGPFHGEPSPSAFEWEVAARRERIIREEVERRLVQEAWLVEEEVRRELDVARARFHGGFGPVPFVGPDGPTIVPPPPLGPFFRPGSPFAPPMPLPLVPVAVGMHPNWPPPPLFGSWDGFGPRRLAGFGQPMLLNETTTRPLPPPTPRHQLQLRQIAPTESSEVLSSEMKASGVKRKADASSAATKQTKLQNASSATTQPTKLQNAARDWSCALCQVSATSEAGLNQHLQGKRHKAKLVQCGAIKVNGTNRSGLQVTTGNNDGAGPSDAPKKIHILVDGEMHQVVQKSNYIWCERCKVSCTNALAMADHLRGKKHSLLNKVWASIKAVRMNKEVKEDSAAACERKVNENSPGIPEEHEEDTYMTSEFSGDGSSETSMETKETTYISEVVDANSRNVIPVEIKQTDTDTATASKVNITYPAETKQEGTDVDVVMDVNKSFLLKVHQKSRKKADKNFLLKVHQESRMEANKKFLLKAHSRSRKKESKNFVLKAHQKSRRQAKKLLGIREVNENSSIEIPAEESYNEETTDAATDLTEPVPKEE